MPVAFGLSALVFITHQMVGNFGKMVGNRFGSLLVIQVKPIIFEGFGRLTIYP